MTKSPPLSDAQISEIIEMALSDHVSFAAITAQYGVSADQVKAIMRGNLKPGSYRAWRKRVREFGDRRENYK
ncbi:TIGR03643 family protein [Sphingorhabdus arenilitoris]|uniref:TIGR03643 family protein n=1 Tax=Sphingorhabdus arenilitoris TaxID=1490041 RepID=A0ABV8RF65_9SPHN